MRKSHWTALVLVLLVVIWLATGRITGFSESAPAEADRKTAEPPAATRVRVTESRARPVVGEVVIHGNTAPLRAVTVRAEVNGRVVAVPAERGRPVDGGAVLVRIDPGDRRARLEEARALVRQRELEFEGARSLRQKGLQAEANLAAARAALEAARARQRTVEIELDRSTVEAPFAGILDERPVEVGDYVATGDPVARIVQLDPFIVTGPASERQVTDLVLGRDAKALLMNGREMGGFIRYIAATADASTRTFTVELEVPNPEGLRFAGTTAEIHVPLPPVTAHRVPPSVLSLDDAGTMGVKTVNGDDVVEFHEADVVRAEPDWIWLSGLPEQVRVITVGQGFVQAGDRVVPVVD